MKIQHIVGGTNGNVLQLAWKCFYDTKQIVVNVATDIEFYNNSRMFILPPAEECSLTLATGWWFVRIGVFIGDPTSGYIEWSGVVEPFCIELESVTLPPLPESAIAIVNTTPIQGGVRLHTGIYSKYYAFIEYSKDDHFLASETKMLYVSDWGRGYVDCTGLSPDYTYNIRLSTFVNSVEALPTNSIRLLGLPSVVLSKRTARPLRFSSNADHNTKRADEQVLRGVKENKNQRFSSYADYVRYRGAAARAGHPLD